MVQIITYIMVVHAASQSCCQMWKQVLEHEP